MTNFIKVYNNTLTAEFCDKMIEYYETSENKFIGRTMSGTNKKWKDSTDLTLMDGDDFAYRHFIKHLDSVLDKCIMNYYDCFNISGKQKIDDHYSAEELYATNSLYTRMDNYLMKRYKAPKQGYNGWHCDWSRQELAINRQLIVMFYLNDVKKGGETEFYYQKIKIKPKKGTLVVFPSWPTHYHKGHNPISNDKYICNAWLTDIQPKNKVQFKNE